MSDSSKTVDSKRCTLAPFSKQDDDFGAMKISNNNSGLPIWLWIVFGVIIIAILAGSYWLYKVQAQQLEQKVIVELEFINGLKVDLIKQWREDHLADADAILASPFFVQGVKEWITNPQPDVTEKFLNRFKEMKLRQHYSNVLLVDATGVVSASLYQPVDRLAEENINQLKIDFTDRKPFLTDLYLSEKDQTPILDLIVPLFKQEKNLSQPIGALILQIDPEQFLYPLIQSWPDFSQTIETLMVRREGDQVLFLNAPRHQKLNPFDLKISLSHTEAPSVEAVLGKEGAFIGTDYRGHDVLSSLLPIPGSPWYLVTKMDINEAFSQILFNKWLIIALAIGLISTAMLGTGLLGQYMRKLHYKTIYKAEKERQALLVHFEHLIKYANDIIFLVDENMRIVEANDRALEAYGYSRQEMFELELKDLIAPEDLEAHRARMMHIDEKGAILTEAVHQRKDRSKFPVEVSARSIEVRGGKYIQAIGRDISERKHAEELLRKEQEKFRFLSETAPFGMVAIGKDGVFKYINPKFTEIFGYDLNDVPNGKEWFRKAYPDSIYRRHVISAWMIDHERHKAGEKRPRIYLVRCKDGSDKFISFIPIQLETGDDLMFCDDITERKKSEEKVKESEERYRALFDRSLDCVYVHDFEGNFIDANEAALSLFGYEKKDLKLLNYSDLLSEDQIPLAKQIYKELIKTGYQKNIAELRVKQKNGQFVYIEAKTSLIYHEGNPYAVQGIARDITKRKQAEDSLRESEERYRIAAQCTGQLIYDYDISSGKIHWTGAIEAITGFSVDEFNRVDIAAWESLIHPEDRKRATDLLAESINSATQYSITYRLRKKDGSYIYIEDIGGFLTDADGKAIRMFGAMKDITSRKQAEEELQKLEEQLIQSQKLESIGRLAGGVAHDFNNMLAIIIGYSDIMLKEISDTDPIRGKTKEIMKAAERAKDLTRQLLAFARKQTLAMTHLDLNHVVSGFERMIRRALREHIEIKIHLSTSECFFYGDVGQIEQIILHLALNAQDAMPKGGVIVLETASVYLDDAYSNSHEGILPGNYVALLISDSGMGMTKDAVDKIFEPFYTTKEVGKGPGLGLPMVYGIVKQHGGNISVYSEPGKGTAFKIYFPQINTVAEQGHVAAVDATPGKNKETILVVEDNENVRALSCEMLKLNGFKVIDTPDGKKAMELANSYTETIDLLITDVIMPEMNGWELHEHLSKMHKNIKTLFMSGYPEEVISHHGVLDVGVNFIQKPFSLHDFVTKVRGILDVK